MVHPLNGHKSLSTLRKMMAAFWKMFWSNYCKQDQLAYFFSSGGNFGKRSSDIVSCVGFCCKFLFKHVKTSADFGFSAGFLWYERQYNLSSF